VSIDRTLIEFHVELDNASSLEEVQELRTKYLGKKSYVKTALKSLGAMSAEERPKFAQAVNEAARTMEEALTAVSARFAQVATDKQVEAERQDLTLPGIAQERGSTHQLTQVHRKAMDVMRRLGFTLAEGPEI
jgi:phenylalanyl-tRNA synthetase alpha chain